MTIAKAIFTLARASVDLFELEQKEVRRRLLAWQAVGMHYELGWAIGPRPRRSGASSARDLASLPSLYPNNSAHVAVGGQLLSKCKNESPERA